MEKTVLLLNQHEWRILAVSNNPQNKIRSTFLSRSPKSNVRVNDYYMAMRKKSAKRSNHHKQPPVQMPLSSTSPFRTRNVVVFISVLSAVAVIAFSWNAWSAFRLNGVVVAEQVHSFEIVNEFPHDPSAFTQGLLYGGNDTLFESTGLHGKSSVREVDIQTGKIKRIQNMDYSDFGEGLTLFDQRLYQVTWLKKTGYIYDRDNFGKFKRFTHGMKDGWGLATDGKVIFGSDGSSSIYQMDPRTMKVITEHVIKYKGHEVYNLNELEYINNEVWANILSSDCIVRISPVDGSVIGWIVLPELRAALVTAGNRIDVLNGIAWDEDKKRIFITGKLWPKLFEIKLQPVRKPLSAPIEQLCLTAPFHFK